MRISAFFSDKDCACLKCGLERDKAQTVIGAVQLNAKCHSSFHAVMKTAGLRKIVGLIFSSLVDAGDGVQTSRISDVRKALRNHLDQERFVIAQIHIAL